MCLWDSMHIAYINLSIYMYIHILILLICAAHNVFYKSINKIFGSRFLFNDSFQSFSQINRSKKLYTKLFLLTWTFSSSSSCFGFLFLSLSLSINSWQSEINLDTFLNMIQVTFFSSSRSRQSVMKICSERWFCSQTNHIQLLPKSSGNSTIFFRLNIITGWKKTTSKPNNA